MTRGTEQIQESMQSDTVLKGSLPPNNRQHVDRCARILRIVLLARKSCPYSSAQNDVRGILLDSLLLKLLDSPPGVTASETKQPRGEIAASA